MTSGNHPRKNQGSEFDYLCVDDFIKTVFDARALATAFEIRLIDSLLQNKHATLDSLAEQLGTDSRGMRLLLDLLLANRVVKNENGKLSLTEEFADALQFRELLELKLIITNFAAHDLLDYFSDLVSRPEQFVHKARFFRLFGYNRCFDYSQENYELTKRWMRITTTFTKYEAQACMKYYDFSQYRRILDIGGNSGEFALQICRRYPGVSATVFDLPLVCDIGQEHIRSEPEADRISFIRGNALTDPLPEGFDLITFKSMLHDWPEKEAKHFIEKASHSLEPGGTLLIFERGPLEVREKTFPYSMSPILVFFHSFRSPNIYEEHLKDLGFQAISIEKINLETPFYLVTAKKKLRE
jgi:ubiquinone/menaquinone biosynthesis C-methylase UbiE